MINQMEVNKTLKIFNNKNMNLKKLKLTFNNDESMMQIVLIHVFLIP
jgi:hypothetical protein